MKIGKKCLALLLVAMLLLAPAAQALTPDQLKELLQKHYINEVPQAAMQADTVDDILEALNDPYTVYMTEEEYADFNASMSDSSVVGIGISALGDEKGLLIVGTYEESPARELGLVAGDIIIRVGDHDAAGAAPEVITSWLKGEEGTKVTFRVLHQDGSEKDYTATRAKVVIPTATTELLENGTTGYLICDSFGPESLGHFTEGVKAYDDANLWIVDLQSNGGGDVYAVSQAMGVFLGEGTTVYLRDGSDQIYCYVSEQEAETISPVIVLTSGVTASAAEIFALGIKDQTGGMIIGSNTFGKGVAQVILTGKEEPEALTDNDALKITAYQYYGLNGEAAQTIGVIPDLLVPAEDAFAVASLFSSVEPKPDYDGWIRLDLGGWRWYVEIASATEEENMATFAEMLSAVPPGCDIFLGTGDDWTPITVPALVKKLNVKGFTSRWFTDVDGKDCQLAANTLATYQMLRGYGDGTFRPDKNLTRGEFCAILAQALSLPETENEGTFSDVSADSWYASCVQAVVDEGLMNGVSRSRFAPNDRVTHEQMITVMGRLAAKLHSSFYFAAEEVPTDLSMVPDTYSDWAREWVWLLSYSQTNMLNQRLNLLYEEPENIAPEAPATRGETAQVLYSILASSQIITY